MGLGRNPGNYLCRECKNCALVGNTPRCVLTDLVDGTGAYGDSCRDARDDMGTCGPYGYLWAPKEGCAYPAEEDA